MAVTPAKARKILRHRKIRGIKKQRGLFGRIAGRSK